MTNRLPFWLRVARWILAPALTIAFYWIEVHSTRHHRR